MKTETIKTTDYLKLGWDAYFSDFNWEYIILRDSDPWKVYYRQIPGGFPGWPYEDQNTPPTISEKYGWQPVEINTAKLKKYILSRARPETWKNVSNKFYESHDVAMICDGPCLSIEFTKPNGKIRELGYMIHEFPEEWHPSYQKACRLMRYLNRNGKKAKSGWSGVFGGVE